MNDRYDVVVIGAGPAGEAAALHHTHQRGNVPSPARGHQWADSRA